MTEDYEDRVKFGLAGEIPQSMSGPMEGGARRAGAAGGCQSGRSLLVTEVHQHG